MVSVCGLLAYSPFNILRILNFQGSRLIALCKVIGNSLHYLFKDLSILMLLNVENKGVYNFLALRIKKI